MPTLIRFGRFRVVIYPGDHLPKHVHVLAAEAEAKFEIETGCCIAVRGFTRKTVKQLTKIILQHQTFLLLAWEEYNGETQD